MVLSDEVKYTYIKVLECEAEKAFELLEENDIGCEKFSDPMTILLAEAVEERVRDIGENAFSMDEFAIVDLLLNNRDDMVDELQSHVDSVDSDVQIMVSEYVTQVLKKANGVEDKEAV